MIKILLLRGLCCRGASRGNALQPGRRRWGAEHTSVWQPAHRGLETSYPALDTVTSSHLAARIASGGLEKTAPISPPLARILKPNRVGVGVREQDRGGDAANSPAAPCCAWRRIAWWPPSIQCRVSISP